MKAIIFCLLILPACATAKTYRMAVLADMNESYGSKSYPASVDAAVQNIARSSYNVVLSAGDMVAGQKSGLDYAGMWDAFHTHVTRPLDRAQIPLLPSPGNHDASAGRTVERDHYSNTWKPFAIDRFNNGRPADERVNWVPGVEQNYPFNYAVTLGPALILALDATTPGGLSNGQLEWMDRVLTQNASAPLKIVFGHVPLYPFTFNRAHEYLATDTGFGAAMEALLEKHHVQLLVNGHHHAYYQGRRKGMTRYVSVPLLGSGPRILLTANRSETHSSPQGYIDIQFNEAGTFSVRAVGSPSLNEIPLNSLPEAISIPPSDAADCRHCGSFPAQNFLDSSRRTVYLRF